MEVLTSYVYKPFILSNIGEMMRDARPCILEARLKRGRDPVTVTGTGSSLANLSSAVARMRSEAQHVYIGSTTTTILMDVLPHATRMQPASVKEQLCGVPPEQSKADIEAQNLSWETEQLQCYKQYSNEELSEALQPAQGIIAFRPSNDGLSLLKRLKRCTDPEALNYFTDSRFTSHDSLAAPCAASQ